jgi:hypothetical protein
MSVEANHIFSGKWRLVSVNYCSMEVDRFRKLNIIIDRVQLAMALAVLRAAIKIHNLVIDTFHHSPREEKRG